MRGTTRTVAVAAMSAVALLAAGCGSRDDDGGSSETTAAGSTGGEIVVNGCTPENPLIAGNTSETCGGNILDTDHGEARPLQRRGRRARERHRRVHRDRGQPDLHGQAQAGLHVLRRHRGQGQELRRRVELHRVRPERPGRRLLLRPDRGLRRGQRRGRHHRGACPASRSSTTTPSRSRPPSRSRTSRSVWATPPSRRSPTSFFEDPEAFGKAPVGAGPFMFDSWTEGQSIVVKKNPDYSGDFGARPGPDHLQDLPGHRRGVQRPPGRQHRPDHRHPDLGADRRQVQDRPPGPQRGP